MTNKKYPLVTIITCVYNGEKYIANLFESVLHMGYPNVQHIVVNDGSTDHTEQIIEQYEKKYISNQIDDRTFYITYIKQENHGLGYATNVALKHIDGKYWTWINCDDTYRPQAFFEPVELLEKSLLSYVQMNGMYCFEDGSSRKMVDDKNHFPFNNKKRILGLSGDYNRGFRYLLYLCKTEDYKRINPTMSIYPSRYTQDEQFIFQIFGVLDGGIIRDVKWNYNKRGDSYLNQIFNKMSKEVTLLREESIRMLSISNKVKRTLLAIVKDVELIDVLKGYAIQHKVGKSTNVLWKLLCNRLKVMLSYRIHLDHKLLLYYLYSFVFFLKH